MSNRLQNMPANQQTRNAPVDRVEQLARDIYAGMLSSHLWTSSTLRHVAAQARLAATVFYEGNDNA